MLLGRFFRRCRARGGKHERTKQRGGGPVRAEDHPPSGRQPRGHHRRRFLRRAPTSATPVPSRRSEPGSGVTHLVTAVPVPFVLTHHSSRPPPAPAPVVAPNCEVQIDVLGTGRLGEEAVRNVSDGGSWTVVLRHRVIQLDPVARSARVHVVNGGQATQLARRRVVVHYALGWRQEQLQLVERQQRIRAGLVDREQELAILDTVDGDNWHVTQQKVGGVAGLLVLIVDFSAGDVVPAGVVPRYSGAAALNLKKRVDVERSLREHVAVDRPPEIHVGAGRSRDSEVADRSR